MRLIWWPAWWLRCHHAAHRTHPPARPSTHPLPIAHAPTACPPNAPDQVAGLEVEAAQAGQSPQAAQPQRRQLLAARQRELLQGGHAWGAGGWWMGGWVDGCGVGVGGSKGAVVGSQSQLAWPYTRAAGLRQTAATQHPQTNTPATAQRTCAAVERTLQQRQPCVRDLDAVVQAQAGEAWGRAERRQCFISDLRKVTRKEVGGRK